LPPERVFDHHIPLLPGVKPVNVKDMSTKRKRGKNDNKTNEPKCHIVLSGKRNIVGIEDKSDISEDYERDDRITPFNVTKDPSILINAEDTPWLRQDYDQGT